ncbi:MULTISPECIES: hypothetical protein [unclassified Synechococcus]|uniref:hypothetical protein n=1 Tax=unclassified Synechococcus TaxID=2626047 RepID=UPI001C245E15|nr:MULTISPECIES: hypothetical protein [unclassified Synechococcus]
MNLLGQALISLITTGGALYVLARFWLKEKIRTEVQEASTRRVRGFQLELDKGLEEYKAELASVAEALRSKFSKSGTDYAIYAEKRHQAIALLFSELLEAELLAGGYAKMVYVEREDLKESMDVRVLRAVNKSREAYFRNALYLTDDLDRQAQEICSLLFDIMLEITDPGETPAQTSGQKRRLLRESLNSFLVSARTELSQGRPNAPSLDTVNTFNP